MITAPVTTRNKQLTILYHSSKEIAKECESHTALEYFLTFCVLVEAVLSFLPSVTDSWLEYRTKIWWLREIKTDSFHLFNYTYRWFRPCQQNSLPLCAVEATTWEWTAQSRCIQCLKEPAANIIKVPWTIPFFHPQFFVRNRHSKCKTETQFLGKLNNFGFSFMSKYCMFCWI